MIFRNCCKTSSIITESQISLLLGEFLLDQLVREEKRCQFDAFEKIEQLNLSDVIDKEKIQITVMLLSEKTKNGYPLIMILKPWISLGYAGNIFYVNEADERREVYFQPFFDGEKAYEYSCQFAGLNSTDEVCEKADKLRMQKGIQIDC